MNISTLGIDLAKNVFQLHGVDADTRVVLRKQLRRNQMAEFFAKLPPCLIGMEACGSAHYWARKLQAYGHTVRLMAPQFVKPYVKTNKNDAADAEAICEAVARPNMRFVAIKSAEQQALLALHRARSGLVKARTALANQMRGLLAEFGLTLAQGIQHIARIPEIIEDANVQLPGSFRLLLQSLYEHYGQLYEHIKAQEQQIKAGAGADLAVQQQLQQIPGIGPITSSAFMATVGNVKDFASGRQLAAWLGLVPGQSSSGGKQQLLGISKRGDKYLRTLLIHGARSVIQANERRRQAGLPSDGWLDALAQRRHKNIAAVALANKSVRIIWAMLTHGRAYEPGYAASRAPA